MSIPPEKMAGLTMNSPAIPLTSVRTCRRWAVRRYEALKACKPDWATTQWRSVGKVTDAAPAAYPKLMYFDANIYDGHSGGPVWFYYANNGRRNLIGIVAGYVEDAKANCGVRITKDVLREVKKWM